jgi:phage FluMu protein Com
VIVIKDIRCPNCKQLLLKAEHVKGEIKCTRCGKKVKMDISKDRASHTLE